MVRQGHRVLVDADLQGQVERYLPTLGFAGYNFDLVASREITRSGFEDVHACFSDPSAFAALSRLIEGPVTSMLDLQAAETALQCIILYDEIALLNPAVATTSNEGRAFIRRAASGNEHEPFNLSSGSQVVSDEIVTVDYLRLSNDGRVEHTLVGNVDLNGAAVPADLSEMYRMMPDVAAAMATYPSEFRMPAYFAEPHLQNYFTPSSDFASTLYEKVRSHFLERRSVVPGSTVQTRLPIFIWYLLGQVNRRHELPQAIATLRERFSATRQELADLDKRMKRATRELERIEIAEHYVVAFENVVSALGQSNFVVTKHIVYQIIDFATGSLPSMAMKLINPEWTASHPTQLTRRSIAAKAFLELLDLENVEHLLSNDDLFSAAEVASIRAEPQR